MFARIYEHGCAPESPISVPSSCGNRAWSKSWSTVPCPPRDLSILAASLTGGVPAEGGAPPAWRPGATLQATISQEGLVLCLTTEHGVGMANGGVVWRQMIQKLMRKHGLG